MIDRFIYHACGTAVMYLLIHSLFYGPIFTSDRSPANGFAVGNARDCPTSASATSDTE